MTINELLADARGILSANRDFAITGGDTMESFDHVVVLWGPSQRIWPMPGDAASMPFFAKLRP